MSKYVFSESFGNFTDKDTEDTVLNKYRKNVIDHILRHYEIHVNSHDRKKLTSHQLLYYHVYGDYRLVLDKDKKLVLEINSDQAKQMIIDGTISGGMIPKIDNCLDVAKNGVKAVCIIDGRKKSSILFELLSDKGSGTLIRE